jgi:hypothetical protein
LYQDVFSVLSSPSSFFGDLPVIGPMLQVIRNYEDKVNYRDADPKLRKMMHLE